MRILLVALAAVPLVAAATPAAAQYIDRVDAAIDSQISGLQSKLRTGIEKRTITAREAQPLRAKLAALTVAERSYRRSGNGFNRREKSEIEQRMRTLGAEIAIADGDRRRPDDRRGGYPAAGR